jgi:hypothetical protein
VTTRGRFLPHLKERVMQTYLRYLRAELRAWAEGNTAKAMTLARWKARAYRMYAVETPYY